MVFSALHLVGEFQHSGLWAARPEKYAQYICTPKAVWELSCATGNLRSWDGRTTGTTGDGDERHHNHRSRFQPPKCHDCCFPMIAAFSPLHILLKTLGRYDFNWSSRWIMYIYILITTLGGTSSDMFSYIFHRYEMILFNLSLSHCPPSGQAGERPTPFLDVGVSETQWDISGIYLFL